jgi:hypothetical protein
MLCRKTAIDSSLLYVPAGDAGFEIQWVGPAFRIRTYKPSTHLAKLHSVRRNRQRLQNL